MIDFKRAYEISNINTIYYDEKIYVPEEDRTLEYLQFYNTTLTHSFNELLSLYAYFANVEKYGTIVYDTILVWNGFSITYKSCHEIEDEFIFFDGNTKEKITVHSEYTKDELFNLSVQHGITERSFDYIRKWHKDYNNFVSENIHKFKRYD